MNFDDTPDEAAWRDRVAHLHRGAPRPARHLRRAAAAATATSPAPGSPRPRCTTAGSSASPGPRTCGGQGGTPMQQAIVDQEMSRARVPPHIGTIGIGMCGPTVIAPRQRRPEAALPHPAAAGRRHLVPAVQRAGLRQRPGRPADQGGARRRRVAGQRPEGLDHAGPHRRLRHPAHPHRSRRRQAPRTHHVRGEHEGARASPCVRCAR